MEILVLLLLLQVKHFVLDSCLLQPEYVWEGKARYGEWGGVQHALVNAAGTLFCFLLFVSLPVSLLAFILDFVAHYHIDWLKGSFSRITGITHPKLGKILTFADQGLHQITYVILVLVLL